MWLQTIGLIVTLGLLTAPLAAAPPGTVVRIGMLSNGNPHSGVQWQTFALGSFKWGTSWDTQLVPGRQ